MSTLVLFPLFISTEGKAMPLTHFIHNDTMVEHGLELVDMEVVFTPLGLKFRHSSGWGVGGISAHLKRGWQCDKSDIFMNKN